MQLAVKYYNCTITELTSINDEKYFSIPRSVAEML